MLLVESYALESAWVLVSLILYIISHPYARVFNETSSHVKVSVLGQTVTWYVSYYTLEHFQVIAYLLVVYRVSSGRAWNAQTDRQISSLQWNHGAQSGSTDMSTSRTTQIPDPPMTQAESSPQTSMPSDVQLLVLVFVINSNL